MTEIYELLQTWVGSVFPPDMSLKVWQYVYDSGVITSRNDLVDYLSEMLTLGVLLAILLMIVLAFMGIIKLLLRAIKWY